MRRTASILAALALTGTAVLAVQTTASAAPTAKKTKPEITLKVDKTVLEVGKKVTLKGKITPKKGTKGDKVIVKQKTGDKAWKTQAKVKVNRKGKFTWSDKPTSAQVRKYKVVLPKTKKHAKAKSKPVTVSVGRWMQVNQVRRATAEGLYPKTVSVANTEYKRSLGTYNYYTGDMRFAEYNLFRKCYTLRTEVALTDDAPSNTSAVLRTELDGTTKSTSTVDTLGTSTPLTVDLTNAYRIRFEIETDDVRPQAEAAFLSPEFLCSE